MSIGARDVLKYHFYISICQYCFGSQVAFVFFQSHWRAGRSHKTRQLLRRTAQSHAQADKLAIDIFHSVRLYKLHKKCRGSLGNEYINFYPAL